MVFAYFIKFFFPPPPLHPSPLPKCLLASLKRIFFDAHQNQQHATNIRCLVKYETRFSCIDARNGKQTLRRPPKSETIITGQQLYYMNIIWATECVVLYVMDRRLCVVGASRRLLKIALNFLVKRLEVCKSVSCENDGIDTRWSSRHRRHWRHFVCRYLGLHVACRPINFSHSARTSILFGDRHQENAME